MGIIFLLFPPISHSSFLLKLHNIPLNQFPNDGHLDDFQSFPISHNAAISERVHMASHVHVQVHL